MSISDPCNATSTKDCGECLELYTNRNHCVAICDSTTRHCRRNVREGELLCSAHSDHVIHLSLPNIESLTVWARYLIGLVHLVHVKPPRMSFSVDDNEELSLVRESLLMRVHGHLLKLSVPTTWEIEPIDNGSTFFRIEESTASTYTLEHKNTSFMYRLRDLDHFIRWKSSVLKQRPSQVMQKLSIYQYKVQESESGLDLAFLSEEYGYMDAENWVNSLTPDYVPGFTSPGSGDPSGLVAYIDEHEKNIDGFVAKDAKYGYYGRHAISVVEVFLTATTLSKGVVSIGTKVDLGAVSASLDISLLDDFYAQEMRHRLG